MDGNSDRLTQLLDNLLNNARDHARRGSQIRVTLDTLNDFAMLAIENEGDPLPADRTGMFSAFVSLRTTCQETNVGLGLYVAKVIAESHGGTITASDLPDAQGARFEVRLPLATGSTELT